MIERRDDWKVRSVVQALSPSRQIECIIRWLPKLNDRWFFEQILETLRDSPVPIEKRREALDFLRRTVTEFRGRYEDKATTVQKIDAQIKVLGPNPKT